MIRATLPLFGIAALGCGGEVERDDDSPRDSAASAEVPVYLMRPQEPAGDVQPTTFVAGGWSATGGNATVLPQSEALCLTWSGLEGAGSLRFELAESVDLALLGVTGITFTAVAHATDNPITFGVIDTDGNAACQSRAWGDSALAFAELTEPCLAFDTGPDLDAIRTLLWRADASAEAHSQVGFCVAPRLIDDSYLL